MEHLDPIKIFISYSHNDLPFLRALKSQLRILERNKLIETWDDAQIEVGTDWDKAIKDALKEADIVLLLISASFLASDYCYEDEMLDTVERGENGEIKVIPIILSACLWEDTPFAKLQVLPDKGIPIEKEFDRIKNEVYLHIVTEIKEIAIKIQNERKALLEFQEKEAAFLQEYEDGEFHFAASEWESALQKYNRCIDLYHKGFKIQKTDLLAKKKACQKEIDYESRLKRARKKLAEKKLEAALEELKKAEKINHTPEVKELIFETEQAISEEERKKKLESFKQTIKVAEEHFKKKEWTPAIRSFESALNIYEDSYLPTSDNIHQKISLAEEELKIDKVKKEINLLIQQDKLKDALNLIDLSLQDRKDEELSSIKKQLIPKIRTIKNSPLVEPANAQNTDDAAGKVEKSGLDNLEDVVISTVNQNPQIPIGFRLYHHMVLFNWQILLVIIAVIAAITFLFYYFFPPIRDWVYLAAGVLTLLAVINNPLKLYLSNKYEAENWTGNVENFLRTLGKKISTLRGSMHKLKEVIYQNRKEIETNIKLASTAKSQGRESILILKARKAARLKEENEELDKEYKAYEIYYRILRKLYENSEIIYEDLKDQIKTSSRRAKILSRKNNIKEKYSSFQKIESIRDYTLQLKEFSSSLKELKDVKDFKEFFEIYNIGENLNLVKLPESEKNALEELAKSRTK